MQKPEVTKLSSRGQMVIPQNLRKKLGLEEGQQFVVIGEGDTIIFKRMEMPSTSTLKKMLEFSRKKAKEAGLKKSDITKAIKRVRKQ
jgi:AbrB family looped-hinge helix DNA binding protein